MKKIFNSGNPKSLSVLFIIVLCITIGFTSCSKSDNEPVIASALMVTNISETSPPQDFFLDNVKVNSSALAYTQSTGYFTVSGNRVGEFRTAGTATVNASFGAIFTPGDYYSVYYTGNNSIIATENDRASPAAGKARVRFINASSAINASVDFAVAGGAKIVSGLVYNAISDYQEVNAAATFSLYAAGSGTVLLNIPATIEAGKIYTIYVSGATNVTVSYHVVLEN